MYNDRCKSAPVSCALMWNRHRLYFTISNVVDYFLLMFLHAHSKPSWKKKRNPFLYVYIAYVCT